MPKLKKLAETYAAKGLTIVAPSLDAEEKVKAFFEKHQLNFAVVAGADKSSEDYGVKYYPTMFLVGKDGKVIWKGHHPDDEFQKKLDAALAN